MFEKLLCLGGLIIGTLLTYLAGREIFFSSGEYLLLGYTIGLMIFVMSCKDLLRNYDWRG